MDHDTDAAPGGAHRRPHDGRRMRLRLERIVRTMAEMEQGMRAVGSLDTLASPLAARRIRKVVHGARMSGTGTRSCRTTPPRVRTVAWTHPSAGVTEGLVLVDVGARTRPYCVRLEQEGDRWRIVELAPPDAGLRAAVTEASRNGRVPVDGNGIRRSSGSAGTAFSTTALPGDPMLPIESDPPASAADGHVAKGPVGHNEHRVSDEAARPGSDADPAPSDEGGSGAPDAPDGK